MPPNQNSEFLASMEEVLDVYKRPYDEKRPVVCMDKSPKQITQEAKESILMAKGRESRVDYEYITGMDNILIANEPLRGKRTVDMTHFQKKLGKIDKENSKRTLSNR